MPSRYQRDFSITDWFLAAEDRGNPATTLDTRHRDGSAWASGNAAEALIHGAAYFARLTTEVRALAAGDLLLFSDWRGDPDEIVDTAGGVSIGELFADAARRGVIVKGLIWRSHWDRLAFSAAENRHLGEDIEAAGGECLLDMRVRRGGSHHQKFVVLRHRGAPQRDVAFVGGIDLCHSRHDDERHFGDRQRQRMSKVYGAHPPWHDVQLELHGPVVGDVEAVFRERWDDPTPLMSNPIYWLGAHLRHQDEHADPLPAQQPDPPPAGSTKVQLLRTYGYRRRGYPFAPQGERSVARGYQRAIAQARRLIYVEDQYFWSAEIVRCFADALRANPQLRLVVVLPQYADQDGRLALPPYLAGRREAVNEVVAAGGERVALYGLENEHSVPIYVHAKVCVVDDVWASVGSDNVNRRSWTHDSELTCAVLDEQHDDRAPLEIAGATARRFARDLRLRLTREHLGLADGGGEGACDAGLIEAEQWFTALARSASRLQAWHDSGHTGERPQGRLRPYVLPELPGSTRRWARTLYRAVYDPDGRPAALRRRKEY